MSTSELPAKNDQRDPNDELLVALIAEGWTHRRIASFCGISTKTIQRRMNDEDFAQRASLMKRQRLNEIIARTRRTTDKALNVLNEAMDNDDVTVRMRAAKSALDYQERFHRRAIFEADLDERISNLEAAANPLDEVQFGDSEVASLADADSYGLIADSQRDSHVEL